MTTFGLQLPSFTFPDVPDDRLFDRITEIAQAAESSGFDSFWVMDHYHQIRNIGPASDPMLEAYTLLGAVAARTSRVKLGAMVTGVTYRNPAFLAKVVTTLDVVSSGRAILGIGAAWNEEESLAYGYDWPSTSERFERLGGRAADLPDDVHAAAVDVPGGAASHRGRVQHPAARASRAGRRS